MEYTEFSEILVEITGGQDPITTIKEVAFHMGRDEQTVYGYRKGGPQPNWDDACRLSCWLAKEKGYYKLGMQALLVCMGGKANGKVDDEIMGIIEVLPMIRNAFKSADKTTYLNCIGILEQQIRNLRAEAEAL